MTDPAKDAERLAQCPFCGSTNIDPREWLRGDGKSGPGCSDCGATAESADAWNRRPIETRLTQERDAACKAHVECAESLDVAARERDEARRSAETLEAEVGRLCAERDAVVDDFASDCAAQPAPDDVERALDKEARAAVARILDRHMPEYTLWRTAEMYDEVASLIAAARREGAEAANARYLQDHLDLVKVMYREREAKVAEARREGAELRALDEAVIEAARRVMANADHTAYRDFAGLRIIGTPMWADLVDALAARDAAIRTRDGEEESDAV